MDFRRVTRSMSFDPGGGCKYGNFVRPGSVSPNVPSPIDVLRLSDSSDASVLGVGIGGRGNSGTTGLGLKTQNNPKPKLSICNFKSCQRKIKDLQHWLLCNKCGCRFHRTCVAPGISPYGFSQLKKTLWHCQDCSNISAVTDDTDYDTNDNLDTPFDTNSGSSLLASNSDFNFNAIKGLKFGHLNINGLDGKFDELQSFLTTFNFHAFSLNELRLGSVKKLSFYEIPNYTFLPFLNSPKYRGGSAFYIHDSCKFEKVEFKTVFPDFVEVNVIEIKIPFT